MVSSPVYIDDCENENSVKRFRLEESPQLATIASRQDLTVQSSVDIKP